MDADPRLREHTLLAQIASLNSKRADRISQAGELLREHVLAADAQYTTRKYASEQFGKALFKGKLEQYLAKQCSPWQVCNMVAAVERAYDYPSWLGDMWNACDWVDPSHTHETFSHLRWEVEITLAKLT
ncbi:MAG: hypothetical protein ABL932_07935 [Terricaulis sp.]